MPWIQLFYIHSSVVFKILKGLIQVLFRWISRLVKPQMTTSVKCLVLIPVWMSYIFQLLNRNLLLPTLKSFDSFYHLWNKEVSDHKVQNALRDSHFYYNIYRTHIISRVLCQVKSTQFLTCRS